MTDTAHVNLMIDGRWTRAVTGQSIDIVNPATEEVVATACQAGREDTASAITAAGKGLDTWSRVAPWDRSRLLRKAASLLEDRSQAIAERIVRHCGKPMAQALAETRAATEVMDWFADEARRIFGSLLPGRTASGRLHTLYEPVGIAAAFSAWNFPLILPARKIAAALAAGCAVLCRPAEEGSACAAELIQCLMDAGIPPGTVNLLTGRPEEISDTIMESPEVRKISFTGSIPVGQELMRRAADTVKRLTLELGGHSPVIIHHDADPEETGAGAAAAKFRNNGQVCISPTRFFVHSSICERFTAAFAEATRKLKLGNGMDPSVDIGPLINRNRLEAIEQMVARTLAEGATLVLGGRRPAALERGFFFEPTVFTDVSDEMTVMEQEPFGPIALVTPFETFEEAIRRANAVHYGLAAYVFTKSLELAQQSISSLKVGIVTVNGWTGSMAEMPFGGVKYSGYGREGGEQGIFDYLDVKFANINWGYPSA
jgi:succinate-semialdehyde dehydrogenase/glutarate-semialdehyde dehydrogenase